MQPEPALDPLLVQQNPLLQAWVPLTWLFLSPDGFNGSHSHSTEGVASFAETHSTRNVCLPNVILAPPVGNVSERVESTVVASGAVEP